MSELEVHPSRDSTGLELPYDAYEGSLEGEAMTTNEVDMRDSLWWQPNGSSEMMLTSENLFRPFITESDDDEEDLVELRKRLGKVEWGLCCAVGSYLLVFTLLATFMPVMEDRIGVILRVVCVILNYVAAACYFVVGGRRHIDWRIVGELKRTWKCYVIAAAVVLNIVVDFIAPWDKEFSKIDTWMFAFGVFWFLFQDAIIYLSRPFRWLSTGIITVCVFWNFAGNLLDCSLTTWQEDERIWGVSRRLIKCSKSSFKELPSSSSH